MKPETTQAIVLTRTNYGEADKIVTSLTSHGKKISIIAKGVRKPKSKLVAGTELFCIADICFVQGRGSMATLTSARLHSQHTRFLHDLNKVNLAYDVIKVVNKHTEDSDGEYYFEILKQLFAALDNTSNDIDLVRIWAWMQILHASGHQLRLDVQANGEQYKEESAYDFDADSGGFVVSPNGNFAPTHIKLLRIAQTQPLSVLQRVNMAPTYAYELTPVIKQFVENTY
ncbi:MAG: DNA repair protein RecO [Candidatus Saccharimonadales bacterium]